MPELLGAILQTSGNLSSRDLMPPLHGWNLASVVDVWPSPIVYCSFGEEMMVGIDFAEDFLGSKMLPRLSAVQERNFGDSPS